nr:hypothetical protein [Klebsiella variicola]
MAVIIVTCSRCGARMHNRRTNWHKSGEYATCYYTCTNVDCSRTSAWSFSRDHDITPSGLDDKGAMQKAVARLRPDERQMLLELLQSESETQKSR